MKKALKAEAEKVQDEISQCSAHKASKAGGIEERERAKLQKTHLDLGVLISERKTKVADHLAKTDVKRDEFISWITEQRSMLEAVETE